MIFGKIIRVQELAKCAKFGVFVNLCAYVPCYYAHFTHRRAVSFSDVHKHSTVYYISFN